jgi:hypothetical protein
MFDSDPLSSIPTDLNYHLTDRCDLPIHPETLHAAFPETKSLQEAL